LRWWIKRWRIIAIVIIVGQPVPPAGRTAQRTERDFRQRLHRTWHQQQRQHQQIRLKPAVSCIHSPNVARLDTKVAADSEAATVAFPVKRLAWPKAASESPPSALPPGAGSSRTVVNAGSRQPRHAPVHIRRKRARIFHRRLNLQCNKTARP
jgi:hypothetical protein